MYRNGSQFWCAIFSPTAMLAQSASAMGPVCQTALGGGLTSYYSVEGDPDTASQPQQQRNSNFDARTSCQQRFCQGCSDNRSRCSVQHPQICASATLFVSRVEN